MSLRLHAQRLTVRHWARTTWLSTALLPLAWLYSGIVWVRRQLYRAGILRVQRLPVPVIVVGNFVAGGTGKTPLVLWLVEHLRRAGRQPGIVLRGYAGRSDGALAVLPDSSPQICGDEAVLLAYRSGVPVWIGKKRASAALGLLAANPGVDVIVSDDGLQHLALARDMEIAVIDERGFGNRRPQPAGPLREAPRRVDITVAHGMVPQRDCPLAAAESCLRMQLVPRRFYRIAPPRQDVEPHELAALRVHAVAGIGAPQRFFETLRSRGLSFTPHEFPDHHAYRPADLDFVSCDAIVMTEKDAIKCRDFARHDLIALAVDAQVDAALLDRVLSKINGRPPA